MTRTIIIVSTMLGVFYLLSGLQYQVGTPSKPATGFYPLVVAIFSLVSSVGAYLENIKSHASQDESAVPWGKHLLRPLSIFLAIAVYIIFLPYVGCILGGMIVIFVALQAVGGIRWHTKIILTIGIAVGSYLLFDTLLGVSLPVGMLFSH